MNRRKEQLPVQIIASDRPSFVDVRRALLEDERTNEQVLAVRRSTMQGEHKAAHNLPVFVERIERNMIRMQNVRSTSARRSPRRVTYI